MSATDTLSFEKRAQILAGAGAIFRQDGYEGASMSRIASEACVSKGTLYNHFESKAELFAAYVEEACSNQLGHLFEAIDPEKDPAEGLRDIGRRMAEMMLSDAGIAIYRVVVSEAGKFPDLARAFYAAGPARAIGHMARWLAEQTRRGHLRVPDPEFAAEQFFCLCQARIWLRRRLNMMQDLTPELTAKVVDAAVEMFLHTYGVEEAG